MREVDCAECCEIASSDMTRWYANRREHPWKRQCLTCGAWWELRSVKSIRFCYNRALGMWRRVLFSEMVYAPLECNQRRCREHARHRIATKGKRQFRCDRHAGVCIVA